MGRVQARAITADRAALTSNARRVHVGHLRMLRGRKSRVVGGPPPRSPSRGTGSLTHSESETASHDRWLDRMLTITLGYLFTASIVVPIVFSAGGPWPVVLGCAAIPFITMAALISSRVARFEGVSRRAVVARGFRRSPEDAKP